MLEPGYRNAILLTSDAEAATGGLGRLGAFPAGDDLGVIEVQAHQTRMERRFEISGPIGQRFLRDLPRQRTARPVWLTP